MVVGSAPGGTPLFLHFSLAEKGLAAAFFSTYEAMKYNLPIPPHLAPIKHMIAASVGEVVC